MTALLVQMASHACQLGPLIFNLLVPLLVLPCTDSRDVTVADVAPIFLCLLYPLGLSIVVK